MPCKHIFGSQIENNMLENHADQREMFLLFSLLFYAVATSKAIKSDFFFRAWLLTEPKQETTCKLRYSVNLLTFDLKECRPRGIPWVLSRPQYRFENLLSSIALNMYWKELSGYKGNIPFYICTAVVPVIFLRHTRQKRQKNQFDVFQVKRDAIKSNLSSARLPTSIHWLTTLGLQNM